MTRRNKLLKTFPLQIEVAQARVEKIGQDIQRLESHPIPKDGFAGMEIHGANYTEKDDAGKALLAACQSIKSTDTIAVGSYRGFNLSLSFDAQKQNIALTFKGDMSYKIEMGGDVHGNITRINNAMDGLTRHLTDAQEQLASLHQQQADARSELQNPFAQEAILAEKSARLAELDTALNMDGGRDSDEEIEGQAETETVHADAPVRVDKEPMIAKSKPSILAELKEVAPAKEAQSNKQKKLEQQIG